MTYYLHIATIHKIKHHPQPTPNQTFPRRLINPSTHLTSHLSVHEEFSISRDVHEVQRKEKQQGVNIDLAVHVIHCWLRLTSNLFIFDSV